MAGKEIILKEKKTITLPIYRFMEEYLIREPNVDAARACRINPIDALVIEASKTDFAHIQWFDLETEEPLDKPLIWWKKSWDGTYFNWVRRKQKEAEDRHNNVCLSMNILKIMKAMSKKYGIDDVEVFRKAALKILKSGKKEELAKLFDTKLEV